jgi:hypothetical protein
MDAIRLEEYSGIIQNKLVAAWQAPDSNLPWLPTEFMLTQYITRILVTGRQSPMSTALAADGSWTQIWRSPGAKEWSCLLGILPHMPGPILLVVGPDMQLSPKLVASLKGSLTTIVLRQGQGWSGDPPDYVFFPCLGSTAAWSTLLGVVQDWTSKASPKNLDFRVLMPQLEAQGYGLMVGDGVWQWYKPADSQALVTLTTGQIARQIQSLGSLLERI